MRRLIPKLIVLLLPVVLVPAAAGVLLGENGWIWVVLLALLSAVGTAVFLGQAVQKRIAPLHAFARRMAAGDLASRIGTTEPAYGLHGWGAITAELDEATGRVQAQMAALESSRSELQAVMDSMQEAVVAVDASGRIQWTNQVMQRITGGAVRLGYSLVHTVRDPELLLCLRNTLESREISAAKASSISPGRTFEVNAAPTPGGGAVVVLHDITLVERSETTRRDFIANVSHELRTPLTSISGYVETLLDANDNLDRHAREFLGIILKNATRMNRLTEDLLALARVESGEHKLHPHAIPAEILMEDAVHSLSGLADDMGVELERGPMTQTKVMADSDAIQQVLTNLIENAIKYGKSGAKVVVSATEITEAPSEDTPGFAGVEFRVQDFGPGIAYAHQARIFERFYRVDKARSKAKHIVQAHGGTIRVESEMNMGSSFVFVLPAVNSHVFQGDVTRL
jgi:two-component system phosphate regulon sensor histidine kinase PhoR